MMLEPDDNSLNLLANVRVATPCTADWSTMSGDDKTRFCQECKLNVHNLSAMTKVEAESLLKKQENGERVCVSFFRRADGTVITQDCPVGLKLLKEKARRAWSRVASFVSAFMWLTLSVQAGPQVKSKDNNSTPTASFCPSFKSNNPSLKAGIDQYNNGQYKEAQEFFQKACDKDVKNDEARYYLALALQALNQNKAALAQYKWLAEKASAIDIKAAAQESLKLLQVPPTGTVEPIRTLGRMAAPQNTTWTPAPSPIRTSGEPMPPPQPARSPEREIGKIAAPQK